MAAAIAARLAARTTRSSASRFASGLKPKSAPSPFRLPTLKPPCAPRILRSPVEMSFALESMLPFHTATASALLTSMLSVSPRTIGWTLEDCNDDVRDIAYAAFAAAKLKRLLKETYISIHFSKQITDVPLLS
ncbi:protein NUCLEAR FUSION DEFECTIVE 6, chloroplastic/mitochondrial-like [Heracleum sosnowskyi]|uniref:Protein NUCLEAR FUSION DEFECTIVE 6, chloroplastic/mitochondrial-like n=1 Tax=Heracleum sosnowskyi TaxID=360622 RepID=A0AAD8M8Q5_9APIA|nr:protein NUCLEAR FUSION DEFECTIVE 6, chloroplastic/mitochondrial-like [Heracleum sosnowskyi]